MLSEDVNIDLNNKYTTEGSTWKRIIDNSKTKEGTISVTKVDKHDDRIVSWHRDKHILARTAIEENNVDSFKITPIESQNITTILNTMINNILDSAISSES